MLHPSVYAFITTVEAGSFNKAAAQLHISSTALMKQITSLEERTGLKLAERTYRGIRLTRAGESLYEDSKSLVHFADTVVKRARDAEGRALHTVRLGSSQLYPASYAILLWDAVSARLPQLSIQIIPFAEDGKLHYVTALNQGCDMIFATFDRKRDSGSVSNIRFLETGRARLCVAVPKKHRLCGRAKVGLSQLRGETLMMLEAGVSPITDCIRSDILRGHPDIRVEDYASLDMDMFNRCAENNRPLLSLEIWEHVHPDLIHIPLDVPYTLPRGFIYRDTAGPAARQFLEAAEQYLERTEK